MILNGKEMKMEGYFNFKGLKESEKYMLPENEEPRDCKKDHKEELLNEMSRITMERLRKSREEEIKEAQLNIPGSRELASAHWKYVKSVHEAVMSDRTYTKDEVIGMIGVNYITAIIHGYKHGQEGCVK